MWSLETMSKRAVVKVTFGPESPDAVKPLYLRTRPPKPQAPLTSWGTSSPKSASIRNILAIFSHGPCRILEISGYSQSFNFVCSEKKVIHKIHGALLLLFVPGQ